MTLSPITLWHRLGLASSLMSCLGIAALFVMMVITIADVVGRYLFNSPILGVYELTEFLILILVFSFIGYTQAEKSHVSVDFLVNRLPRGPRLVIELLNHTACLGLMGLIAWMGFEKALELKAVGETSLNLAIPDYPFVFFLALGCVVTCLEYVRNLIRLWTDRSAGGRS